jgi:hypothetical protein
MSKFSSCLCSAVLYCIVSAFSQVMYPSSTYIHLSNVIADNPKKSPLSKKQQKAKEAAVSCEGKHYLDKVFTIKAPKNAHNHNVPTQKLALETTSIEKPMFRRAASTRRNPGFNREPAGDCFLNALHNGLQLTELNCSESEELYQS